MSEGPDVEIVRWFTRARKFPQLIGRTPDGAKIPGGPYTVTQAVGAGLVLIIGLNTMGLWARFGLLGNLVALATFAWATLWLLGRIPVGSRSPLSVTSGLARAVTAPAAGRLGGRPVRIRRPRVLRHHVVIALTHPTTSSNDVDTTVHVPTGPAQTGSEDRPAPPVSNRRGDSLLASLASTQPIEAHRPTTTDPEEPQTPRAPVLSGVQALLAATGTSPSPSSSSSSATRTPTESPR